MHERRRRMRIEEEDDDSREDVCIYDSEEIVMCIGRYCSGRNMIDKTKKNKQPVPRETTRTVSR